MLGLLQSERRRLKHFSLSALVFFIAYGMLYSTQKNMPPSLQQEFTALACIAVAGLAFSWAITLHVLSIIARLHK
jgi:hypothetical protein